MGDTRHLFRTDEDPDPRDRGSGWKMTRPWAKRPPAVAIVSENYFRCRIHFFGGSTVPCQQDPCPSCLKLNVSRWRCYLLAIEEKTKHRLCLELSAEVKQTLDDIWAVRRSLRGEILVCTRTHPRNNAKHMVSHVGHIKDNIQLPPDVDIWPIIARIFGVHSNIVLPSQDLTVVEAGDARAEQDLPGQTVAKFAQRGSVNAICESQEERDLVFQLAAKTIASGNGRTAHD